MTVKSIIKSLLRIKWASVKGIRLEGEGESQRLIVRIEQYKGHSHRCPICGKECRGYYQRTEPRLWRSLDLGGMKVYIEARVRRIECPKHGVLTEEVSWARHRATYTRDFEDTVAYLALNCSL
jgi:transposase